MSHCDTFIDGSRSYTHYLIAIDLSLLQVLKINGAIMKRRSDGKELEINTTVKLFFNTTLAILKNTLFSAVLLQGKGSLNPQPTDNKPNTICPSKFYPPFCPQHLLMRRVPINCLFCNGR